MEKLLLELLLWLLKLVIQLILFAVTGKWWRWGAGGRLLKPDGTPAGPKPVQLPGQQPKKIREQRPKVARAPAPGRVAPGRVQGQPFPFEFAPELFAAEPNAEAVELEPASEAEALIQEAELAARRERARQRARQKLKRPAAPAAPRSFRAAIRDRKTVREAIILGEALGPRRGRVGP